VIGLLKKGDIKAYVVADARRSPALPDVPAADEVGLPDFKSTAWNGLMMPKGTPDAIVNKVSQALTKALDDPALLKRFEALGVVAMRPEERGRDYQLKFTKSELERYSALIRKIGITPQ
jgi:tripartite-type tricarboxylate transporter receptor subunit TctC